MSKGLDSKAASARAKKYWAEVKNGTRPAPRHARKGGRFVSIRFDKKEPSRSARSDAEVATDMAAVPRDVHPGEPRPAETRAENHDTKNRIGSDETPSRTGTRAGEETTLRPPASGGGGPSISSVRIGSAYAMPEYSDEMLPPPGAGTSLAPTTPPKAKRESPFWKVMEPTPEEFTNLTETFVRLISKGYDGLAAVREYPGWAHSTEEMDPYRTIIKFALKRIKFDPGLLLVALAVIEIAEMEGTRLAGDLKEHKVRSDAAKLVARVNTIPEGAVA